LPQLFPQWGTLAGIYHPFRCVWTSVSRCPAAHGDDERLRSDVAPGLSGSSIRMPENSDVCLFKWLLLRAPSCKSGAAAVACHTHYKRMFWAEQTRKVCGQSSFLRLVEVSLRSGSSSVSPLPPQRGRGYKTIVSNLPPTFERVFFSPFNESPQTSLFSYRPPQCR